MNIFKREIELESPYKDRSDLYSLFSDAPDRFEMAVRVAYEHVLRAGDRDGLDVGAHTGKHTLPMSQVAKRVLAVEPIFQKIAILVEKAQSRGVQNIFFLPAIAGSDLDFRKFNFLPDDPGKSSTNLRLGLNQTKSIAWNALEIPLDLVSGGFDFGFVKLDAEGHELKVLMGMMATLKRDQPVVHCEVSIPSLEAHGHSSDEIFNLFESLGFTCHSIFGFPLDSEAFRRELLQVGTYDFFFIPQSFPKRDRLLRKIRGVWRAGLPAD